MKRHLILSILFTLIFAISVNAQSDWRYINKENINFKMPESWKMINSSKPHGDICIKIYDPNSAQFVEIRGVNNKVNLKVRVNDIATLRSGQQYFDYMQIDKVSSSTFNGFEAQLLNYTNTYLNDVYKGSIYSFVKEGYTYTVEFYGEDLPNTQSFLLSIASTVNVNSADKKENITKKSETYVEDNWSTMEIDNSAEIAAQEEAKALKLAQKEEEKAQKKAQKALEKQQKQDEKQQRELEKQQRRWDKQQAKAEKQAEEDAIKQAKAEEKALREEQKRIEKENNLPWLRKRNKAIDKELNKIASKQLKLSKQYGKAQKTADQEKMEKIQKQQSELTDRANKLQQEKYEIEEKLSKF